MKTIRFERFGVPHEVAECVEAPDPGAPGEGEVLVDVEAFPINPVDLLTLAGRYAVRPALPAVPGSEAGGKIAAVGAGVEHLRPGDRVALLGRENWASRKRVPAAQVLKLPAGDPLQLAMLKVNPATALLMLTRYVDLAPGEWVIQDAANSAVGVALIRLARGRGLRTVNVVRRAERVEPLQALGADVVLVDGEDLAERIRAATGERPARLAVDAVAGGICNRLAAALAEGGTLVNYGLLSGRPCELDPYQIVFRGITLTGFWLVKHLGAMSQAEVHALYAGLAGEIAAGRLHAPVERTYAIEDIGAALAHAAREGRSGKILVTPNGPPAP